MERHSLLLEFLLKGGLLIEFVLQHRLPIPGHHTQGNTRSNESSTQNSADDTTYDATVILGRVLYDCDRLDRIANIRNCCAYRCYMWC